MENTGYYYLIKHLVLLTGLTDRTIRNYISAGLLQGEKINGLWHFSPEQVESFISHPSVRPSILAKQYSVIYDFLLNKQKKECEICLILDNPGKNRKEIAEYFYYHISNNGYQNIHFSYDGVEEGQRVILQGTAEEVLHLVNDYSKDRTLSKKKADYLIHSRKACARTISLNCSIIEAIQGIITIYILCTCK